MMDLFSEREERFTAGFGQTVTIRGEQGDPGPKGDPGEPGYTPVKGVDYFDGAPGEPGPAGPAGEPGPKGDPGEPGYTPVKGVDYFDGAPGEPGKGAVVDATLTQEGQAADAKVTGEALSGKLTEPSTGLEVGKYFRISAIDEAGHAVLEAVDAPVGGLSTEPSLWPAWTSDEQAAARKRIGLPGDYELLNDITIEEDIAEISISKEQDGTAYKLKKFIVIMSGFSDSVGDSYFRIDAWTNKSPNLFVKYLKETTMKDKYLFLSYEAISPNLFKVCAGVQPKYSNIFMQGCTDISSQNYSGASIDDTNIVKIHFQRNSSTDTLQAGINIKIYGVRAS